MDDMVWTTGGSQAKTFHRIPTSTSRLTGCGKFTGPVVDGQPAAGRLQPRGDAIAAGLDECGRCYGHTQVRKPMVGDRVNDR